MTRVAYGLIATLLTAAGAAGCVEDYGSLAIVQNQVPEDNCSVPADNTGQYLPHGQADVILGGYTLTPLLQSALQGDSDNPNMSVISLRSAVTVIQAVDTQRSRDLVAKLADSAAATRYISGPVQPGSTTGVFFDVIDDAQAMLLAGELGAGEQVEVLVKVVVKGDASGNEVKTAPFYYPITVCKGCSAVDIGPCSSLKAGYQGEVQGTGCYNAGQDTLVECCTTDTTLVCPAVGTGTP